MIAVIVLEKPREQQILMACPDIHTAEKWLAWYNKLPNGMKVIKDSEKLEIKMIPYYANFPSNILNQEEL